MRRTRISSSGDEPNEFRFGLGLFFGLVLFSLVTFSSSATLTSDDHDDFRTIASSDKKDVLPFKNQLLVYPIAQIATWTASLPADRSTSSSGNDSDLFAHQFYDNIDDDHASRVHSDSNFDVDVDEEREYVFSGFERDFQVRVSPDATFLSPALVVRHAAKNYTWLEELPSNTRRCFYAGHVVGDAGSKVTLNVCGGLSGHISADGCSYVIEPLLKSQLFANGDRDSSSSSSSSATMSSSPPSSSSSSSSSAALNSSSVLPAHVLTRLTGDKNTKEIQHCAAKDSTNLIVKVGEPTSSTSKLSRRRRSFSHDLFIEVMVTADSTMKRYHGDGLHEYILTLMSTVAQIFRDPSIGNAVTISVVKIIVTEEHEDRDFVFSSAPRTLRSFCKWQSAQNYDDDSHYLHYDTAILLTREDICRSPKKCDTLGLADLGTMCDPYNSCAIVEDNGLSTAFTIAHEMGHVLNLPHDDDVRCRNFTQENNLRVMARFVDLNTNPWAWSSCSSHYLTEFFDTDSASCLRDRPATDQLVWKALKTEMPGQVFSADKQCELLYGDGSSICPYMPSCGRLWCLRPDNKGCRTHHMPWADGTLCSDDSLCFRGLCQRKDTIVFSLVDGQWSKWSEDGPCSRTCGGGIKRSIRYCNSPKPEHGGKFCVGERVQYKSCNTQDCPPGSTDFREGQCSAFNNYHFSLLRLSPNIRWVPKYSGISPKHRCKLYCRVSTSSDYYVLRDKVVDGTTCGLDTNDICVNGHCLPAGCDHSLQSKMKLDSCGVCGGNNATCQSVSGYYNQSHYGYNRVIVIPAGSINVDIKQFGFKHIKEDDNYLALVSDENKYLLNGDFTVTTSKKKIEYGGAVLEYSGSNVVMERINSSRSLQRDLVVEVLSVGKLHPPEVHYVYNTPITDVVYYKYAWELEESWSECSRQCRGRQFRRPRCVAMPSGRSTSKDKCRRMPMPNEITKSCNDHCQLGWKVTNQTDCMASDGCGSGVIQRTIRCYQMMEDGNHHEVDDWHCSALSEEKPHYLVACHRDCLEATWEYGPWTECSKPCGGGKQTRSAYCRAIDGRFLSDEHCPSDERGLERECGQEECPAWRLGPWTECSKRCNGERQRPYWCQVQNVTLSRTYCDYQPVPGHVEPCSSDQDCFVWDYGLWSMCSVTCGDGIARRLVRCRTADGQLSEDGNCDAATRPAEVLPCSPSSSCANDVPNLVEDDNSIANNAGAASPSTPAPDTFLLDTPKEKSPRRARPLWKSDPWGKCSTTCGSGHRSRKVFCADETSDAVLGDFECFAIPSKPTAVEACVERPCYRWRASDWTKCSKSCGSGTMERLVVCEDEVGRPRVRQQDDTSYANEDCDGIERPSTIATCNEDPCPSWIHGEWSECSTSCGPGNRRRSVYCAISEGTPRSKEECSPASEPSLIEECNLRECPQSGTRHSLSTLGASSKKTRWKTGPWSQCPVTCGPGVQKRQIICLDQHDSVVPPMSCDPPAPLSTQECQINSCPQFVFIDDWSLCTHTCGGGSQWRTAVCVQDKQKVSSEMCTGKEPVEQRACNLEKCPSAGHWKKFPWQQCNKNCVKLRRIICVDHRSKPLAERLCSSLHKPKAWKRCKKCYRPFKWIPGPWMECSASCGLGYRARTVACHQMNRYGWTNPEPMADLKSCNASERPEVLQKCNLGECDATYRWVASKWQPCSVTCGRGTEKRAVRCYDRHGHKVARKKCSATTKPVRQRRCRTRPCSSTSCLDIQRSGNQVKKDQEYTLWVRGKSLNIYCADMNSTDPKEYVTVSSSNKENYSEIYDKRLIRNNTCPNNGRRMDKCDCISVGSMAGLTVFNKIRLNVTSLKVIVDDFRFAKQVHGSLISFGKAGDCYSLQNCPQGRFSVDLSNTGFIVDESTTWIAYGTKPYRRITGTASRQKIHGQCGGYCGVCMPDPGNGLLLDVKQPP